MNTPTPAAPRVLSRWERNDLAQLKAQRTRWMKGWDAALVGNPTNPYTRDDYRRNFNSGFEACSKGRALPYWYDEWKAGQ